MNLRKDTKPEHAFYCADGSILKNLKELAEKLKTISAEAYSHHANEHKNDFRNWIKDVYGNEKLAKEVAFAGNSAEAAAIIEKALAPKAHQKKKPPERKTVVNARRKRTKKRRKPARKRRNASKKIKKSALKKATAAATTTKKKEKKKSTETIKKKRKTKRRPAKKRIMLHKMVHRHLKRIARQWGLM